MKSKILLLLLIPLFCLASDTIKLKKTKVAIGVSMLLPEDFVAMNDDYIASKYPSYRKPLAMYTSPNGKIDFGVNTANNLWGNRLEILKSVYKSSISNLFLKVNFIQDTILTIKKRQFIVFEFVSEQEPKLTYSSKETVKHYTYIMYTVVNHRIFIFNFTAPYNMMDTWQSQADIMLKSIKINAGKTMLIKDHTVKDPIKGKTTKEAILEQRKNKSIPSK